MTRMPSPRGKSAGPGGLRSGAAERMSTVEAYRQEFPILERCLFLNHAGVSPISVRVRQAMEAHLRDVCENGPLNHAVWERTAAEARERAARLIGADPARVALTRTTTEGLNLIACGFRFREGDNVVIPRVEYPANVYPWWNQERRGVAIRWVDEDGQGRVPTEAVIRRIDRRTRIVAVSFVEFASGYRADLEALGSACAERGVHLVVDAIQGLGVLPLDVERCRLSALTCGAHKWIQGPTGAAFFFCREDLMAEMDPVLVGADAVVDAADYLDYRFELLPDARRFEYAMRNHPGVAGLNAALSLLEDVGLEAITRRVKALTDFLVERLRETGCSVFSPRGGGEWSGIVSASVPGGDPARLRKQLAGKGVVVSERAGRLRVSPHYYNDESDLARFLDTLAALR